MNLTGRRHLARVPLTGVWFRAVRPQFLTAALGHKHTSVVPGRFTAGDPARPGAAVLYLAETPELALLEVQVLLGSPLAGRPIPNPAAGVWVIVPVRVVLSSVADLCDPRQLQLLGTSIQELTGDWLGYRERPHPSHRRSLAPSQRLGMALHSTRRVEGLLTYSARDSTLRNLVVFPAKLGAGSALTVTDPATGQVEQRLP